MTTNTKNKNTKTKSKVNGNDPKSFEDSIAALDEVIEKLEGGDLTLDEALTCFETGVGEIKNCESQISRAKGRLAQLLQDSNGEFSTEELDES